MRLLLIEDDQDIARSVSLALKEANYVVDTAEDGENGLFQVRTNNYDLLILDYNLPRLSGREILKAIRDEKINIPILVTTVHSDVVDRVDLLNLGADDYLTKPFVLSELLARIKAILRRPEKIQSRVLTLNGLELDSDKFIVTKNDQRIFLSSKEFALLEYLLLNKGRVLSRQEIMEHVWDMNADPFSNTIEVHIGNLRRKIETQTEKYIYTISNRGYKIDENK